MWSSSLQKVVLLMLLLGCPAVVATTEMIVAAEGSSIMMQAPSIVNASLIQWEHLGTEDPEFILQFYMDSEALTVFPAYRSRVVFYPESGSILLQHLREADSGLYKATVDLMQDKARMTFLEVIKPVPQPKLWASSNLTGSPIKLVCVVPEGTVASISWMKDGHPLPQEKRGFLSENDTVLQIRRAEKSDCGSYSCNISNVATWREATLNLTVTGLTAPLRLVWKLAPATLLFVASSTINFILLCWLRDQRRLGREEWRFIYLSAHLLLYISSLLLLATSFIWMQEEGSSAAFIILTLFLFAAAVGTGWAAVAAMWRPAALGQFKLHVWHQVIRSCTAPTTLIVNLLFAVFLLHKVQQLHERGCSEAVDLVPSCVLTAVAIVFILLLVLLLPPDVCDPVSIIPDPGEVIARCRGWHSWHSSLALHPEATDHRNKRAKTTRNPPSSQSTVAVATTASVMEESRGLKQEGE